MNAMFDPRIFTELLSDQNESEKFVRRALSNLEMEFRQFSLLCLAEWENLGIVSDDLFQSIAGIQRPAWGHWNGLITAIKSIRQKLLRTGTKDVADKIREASLLGELFEFWDTPWPDDVDLRRLLALSRGAVSRRLTIGTALSLTIALRNLVAHAPPFDWSEFADTLHPLIEALSVGRLRFPTPHASRFRSPWFIVEADETWYFNGVDSDFRVNYYSRLGRHRNTDEQSTAVLAAFEKLLGETTSKEKNFKRWLSQLAPQDIRGVLLGDYLVGEPVGSGGFAKVHRATQLSTGRKVAVKIL
jgi:hypothetical protein